MRKSPKFQRVAGANETWKEREKSDKLANNRYYSRPPTIFTDLQTIRIEGDQIFEMNVRLNAIANWFGQPRILSNRQ